MEFEMKIHHVDGSTSHLHQQQHHHQQQQQDEFEKYFARAALGLQVDVEEEAELRRASLQPPSRPHRNSSVTSMSASSDHHQQQQHPRRAVSCKYPKARRKNSASPKRGPNTLSPQAAAIASGSSDVGRASFSSVSGISMGGGGGGGGGRQSPRHSTASAVGKFLEVKSNSAPHSRSNSWKKLRRPGSMREGGHGQQVEEGMNDRRVSVSLEESVCAKLEELKMLQAEDCYVVRNFSTSPEGHLVNRGDSFKRRSANSLTSGGGGGGTSPTIQALGGMAGEGAAVVELVIEGGGGGCTLAADRGRSFSVQSHGSSGQFSTETPPIYRVLVLGSHGVGKTALVQQFMTSEFLGAVETSFDDEGARMLSVLLDGDETIVELVDVPTEQDYRHHSDVAAYVLVYSITESSSFHWCVKQVLNIRHEDNNTRAAVILVGNKSDLVRSRQVAEDEARVVGTEHGCKFVEVSAALNHRVDELLVGIIIQVRHCPEKRHRRRSRRTLGGDSGGGGGAGLPASFTGGDVIDDDDVKSCLETARSLIGKIFRRDMSGVVKSCDNLFSI